MQNHKLLRSPSREVIKSTLGYVKVSIVRLDLVQLESVLPRLLEGLLIWAEDSKNRFRMKVRVVVERLVRKLGLEKVSQHIPEAHTKLITHIRTQIASIMFPHMSFSLPSMFRGNPTSTQSGRHSSSRP